MDIFLVSYMIAIFNLLPDSFTSLVHKEKLIVQVCYHNPDREDYITMLIHEAD